MIDKDHQAEPDGHQEHEPGKGQGKMDEGWGPEPKEPGEIDGQEEQLNIPPPLPPGFRSSASPFSIRQMFFIGMIAALMALIGYSMLQIAIICLAFLLLDTGRYAAMQHFTPRLKEGSTLKKSQALSVEMAGPLPGIVLGLILYLRGSGGNETILFTAYVLLLINAINLLPMKGFCGERITAVFFPRAQYMIRLVFLSLLITGLAAMAWWYHSLWLGLLPLFFIFRLRGLYRMTQLNKEIKRQNIPTGKNISQLTADQLIRLRSLVADKMGFGQMTAQNKGKRPIIEKYLWDTVARLMPYPYAPNMNVATSILAIMLWLVAIAAPALAFYLFPH